MNLAVVVPVRSFDVGKSRLSNTLSSAQRETLARAMAEVVVAPHDDTHWFVVCDDERIATWARSRGATPVTVDARGLNASLREAMSTVVDLADPTHVAICHADLPLAHDLSAVLAQAIVDSPVDHVLLAPDRHRDGTNVAVIPRRHLTAWAFRYGPGSFAAHYDIAIGLGADVVVIEDDRLATDIDTIDDLELVRDFVRTTLPDWNSA